MKTASLMLLGFHAFAWADWVLTVDMAETVTAGWVVSAKVDPTGWDSAQLTPVSSKIIPPLQTANLSDLDQDGLPDSWEQPYTDIPLPQPGQTRIWALAANADDDDDGVKVSLLRWHYQGATGMVSNSVATVGNVHFMPTGRSHYDLNSPATVMSTIKHNFLRDGPNGQDLAEPWNAQKISGDAALANDCMGPWLIYWRQSMPGLNNPATDARGQPIPNWWVFLFY